MSLSISFIPGWDGGSGARWRYGWRITVHRVGGRSAIHRSGIRSAVHGGGIGAWEETKVRIRRIKEWRGHVGTARRRRNDWDERRGE